jgi:hydrogenase maturation protease
LTDHQIAATAKRQTLVVGFGSTLRGDDALGRIVCQRLRSIVDSARVKVIDQTAPTPELAAEVAAATLVVFLDASADGPADEVVTRRLNATTLDHAMAHSLALGTIVELADRLYNRQPPAYLISFRGESFGISDNLLSSTAEAACGSIIQRTLELIGHEDGSDRPCQSGVP